MSLLLKDIQVAIIMCKSSTGLISKTLRVNREWNIFCSRNRNLYCFMLVCFDSAMLSGYLYRIWHIQLLRKWRELNENIITRSRGLDLALLFSIRQVLGSNLGPVTGYYNWRILRSSSIHPGKYQHNTSRQLFYNQLNAHLIKNHFMVSLELSKNCIERKSYSNYNFYSIYSI